MSDKYEDFLAEMQSSGEVDEKWIERIRSTYDASGLRKDLNEYKDKYRVTAEENDKLRTGVLTTTFKSLGISTNPKAFNLPSDLNPTDEEAVSTWAQEMGLIPKVETTDPSERATHDRIANASNEGAMSNIPSAQDLAGISDEDEFYRVAAQRSAALKANR